MDLDSVVDNREQTNTESAAIGEYTVRKYCSLFLIQQYCLFGVFPQMVICIVLIVVFFGLINHIME